MTNPCLTKNGAQRLLHHAVAKLEARGARVTRTEQGMITIDIHRGAATRALGGWRKQHHAEPRTKESAEVTAVEGLLQARGRYV